MDITTHNLDLAIIDQKVAGAFAGKTYAYHHVTDNEGRYALGIAVANEDGYCPVIGWHTRDLKIAQDTAKGMNDHIGLSEEDALSIVISTMGGRRVPVALMSKQSIEAMERTAMGEADGICAKKITGHWLEVKWSGDEFTYRWGMNLVDRDSAVQVLHAGGRLKP